VFNRNRGDDATELDDLITNVISELNGISVDTDNMHKGALSLKVLIEARAAERSSKPRVKISADQWAAIIANVAGIAAILTFEKTNVLTSKALSFVPKLTP
jgi:hypothetical protein